MKERRMLFNWGIDDAVFEVTVAIMPAAEWEASPWSRDDRWCSIRYGKYVHAAKLLMRPAGEPQPSKPPASKAPDPALLAMLMRRGKPSPN